MACGFGQVLLHYERSLRIWWNWQTRYFEVVVGQPVQVQVLLCAPCFRACVAAAAGRIIVSNAFDPSLPISVSLSYGLLASTAAPVLQLQRHAGHSANARSS